MTLYDLIISRRSIRQFRPTPLGRTVLEKIVNAGRLAPSASNLQPLEFIVVDDERVRREIFSFVRWAGYITPAGNPLPGQEPTAYVIPVVNLGVRRSGFDLDIGAAVENMILAAWEEGIGSCWIGALDVEGLSRAIRLRENFKLTCVLALGFPAETPVVEDFGGSVKYWKDDAGTAAGRRQRPDRRRWRGGGR